MAEVMRDDGEYEGEEGQQLGQLRQRLLRGAEQQQLRALLELEARLAARQQLRGRRWLEAWGGRDQWYRAENIDFSQAPATRRDQPGNQQPSVEDPISLINAWLNRCDDNHKDCSKTDYNLPTRLIDLNDLSTNFIHSVFSNNLEVFEKSCNVHIVESSQLSDIEKSEAKYLALSHCWGTWSNQQSEKEKYQFRGGKRAFPFEDLPETFQHAIILTKMIGKRYLWIDSLCINQDDKADWGTESARMYEVFRNAYCTIAATSARNSDEGFLNGFLNGPVTVPDPKSWREKFKADFQDAVENSVLNKRAWVLQERTLSRRILHFTQKQLFLECGRGVCWGPFGYLTNGKISFRSDPNFPASLKDRSVATQIALFQSLFGDYSTYGLTEPTDRPTAIKSLAIAIAKVFDPPITKGNEVEGGRVYNGIFGTRPYLHRSLLWRRIRDPQEHEFSEPLDFSQAQLPHLPPPTWSWMAYKGRIDYLDVENGPEWDTSAGFLGDLVGLQDPVRLKVRGAKCRTAIRFQRKHDNEWNAYEEAQEVAHLWFDQSMPEMCEELRCALIGRDVNTQMGDRKYYVLFIDAGNSSLIRLGVGWIYESAINFSEVTELYIA